MSKRLLLTGAAALAAGMLVMGMTVGFGSPTAFAGVPTDTPVPPPTNTPVPPTATQTPCLITGSGTQIPCTVIPTRTHTPTRTATPTITLTGTTTPIPSATTRPATSTPSGGSGAGTVSPPNTGMGSGNGSDVSMLWLAAGAALVAVGGGALAFGVKRRG